MFKPPQKIIDSPLQEAWEGGWLPNWLQTPDLVNWVQRRKNTTSDSVGAPYKEGAFGMKDGLALSFKEWTDLGSAKRTGKGSTDKGNPRINAKAILESKTCCSLLIFSLLILLGYSFLLGAHSPFNEIGFFFFFCHILFHITVLFCFNLANWSHPSRKCSASVCGKGLLEERSDHILWPWVRFGTLLLEEIVTTHASGAPNGALAQRLSVLRDCLRCLSSGSFTKRW